MGCHNLSVTFNIIGVCLNWVFGAKQPKFSLIKVRAILISLLILKKSMEAASYEGRKIKSNFMNLDFLQGF